MKVRPYYLYSYIYVYFFLLNIQVPYRTNTFNKKRCMHLLHTPVFMKKMMNLLFCKYTMEKFHSFMVFVFMHRIFCSPIPLIFYSFWLSISQNVDLGQNSDYFFSQTIKNYS